MKKLVFILIMLLIAGCAAPPTLETGPVITIAEIYSIALTVDTNGEVHLSGEVNIPTPLRTKFVDLEWLVAFDLTLIKGKETTNTLYILYENSNGDITQDTYAINHPFEITFARDEWVRKIKHDENDNFVVFVEKRPVAGEPKTGVTTATLTSKTVSCPGARFPTELQPNRNAVVCTKEDRLIIRRSASTNGKELLSIYPGETIGILEGPVCADNFWWWKVEVYVGTTYGLQSEGYDPLGTTDQSYIGWAREGWDNKDDYFICQ